MDLDKPDNAQRVWSALAEFGAPLEELAPADLEAQGIVFQIGIAPRRIDILTSIDGVVFDEAWSHKIEIEIEDLRVPALG